MALFEPRKSSDDMVTLCLKRGDAGQVIDGLQNRVEAYEMTRDYHNGEQVDGSIEECSLEDAETMIEVYSCIINTISEQIK
jgi:hypothetical protein